MRGTVRKLVSERGFGFLKCDGQPDVFFHFSTVVGGSDAFDAMYEEQSVEFELADGSDKPRATMVRAV